MIQLSKDFAVPLDVVTQTLAAIGRKGAGKTYLATMIAEQMLDAEAQVVVVDPVGNWWGLRVDADGESKGKQLFVIGGEHGDVPLVPEAGARIARLLVEKRISAVLDVSAFRIGERKRFAADFAEEFFHLKKAQRSPVHLFIEEAQLFIPQRVMADEARMVGAWESIVRLGRNYGVGATLITQRPQSVNKEVLSQVECLCVLQVNGTHERKALEEWVQEAGADRELVGELPGLERGVGYVWSPSWLRVFKKIHFRRKTTFDASATPEVGKDTDAAQLSAVDVEALRADLAEVVKAAEEDDPKALRRRVRELEAQAMHAKPGMPTVQQVDAARAEGARDEAKRWTLLVKERDRLIGELRQQINKVAEAVGVGVKDGGRLSPLPAGEAITAIHSGRTLAETRFPTSTTPKFHVSPNGLKKGQREMLACLAGAGSAGLDRRTLAVWTGMRESGSFSNYLSDLNSRGLVEKGPDGRIRLSATAKDVPAKVPTADNIVNEWGQRHLKAGQRRMLEVIYQAGDHGLTRAELAERSGMAESGSFSNYLSRLSTSGLIDRENGLIRISSSVMAGA